MITEKKIPITKDNVKILGRVVEHNNGFWFLDWTNAGIEFRFTGTDAAISIGPKNAATSNNPCILVYVDDKEPVKINDLSEFKKINVAESLPFGEHTVRIIKVSESTGVPITIGPITISSSEPKEPQLLAPPAALDRKILFFGDSITAGYGNLGTPDNKIFYTYEQDGTQTYASITAKTLNADAHYICISGRGVYQSLDGSLENVIPSYIDIAVPSMKLAWDSTAFVPDLVVINLGTNDSWMGVSYANFETAAKNFLLALRERYPDTKIIWCFGMMGNYYNNSLTKIINEFNTEHGNAYFLPLENVAVFSQEEGGANGHPNVAAHQKRADVLTDKVKEVMGWE